ncbi:hypothetical protein IQ288_31525 [Burkholderia sp. R-69980]|nr:hypothetical protein [Burkholderia sp. R-69980]
MDDLVSLSGRGEAIVRNSGCQWTIVRASWFCQNLSEGHLLDSVLSGTVALPAGYVAEPFIDANDIADVAVAALTDEQHAGQIYEVTGPRLLTFAEAVVTIAQAAGLSARYVAMSSDEYAAMIAPHMPEDFAAWLTTLFADVLDGRNAHLADGVQRALGRDPRDFAEYAREAAASGVWAAGAR